MVVGIEIRDVQGIRTSRVSPSEVKVCHLYMLENHLNGILVIDVDTPEHLSNISAFELLITNFSIVFHMVQVACRYWRGPYASS